MEPTPITPARRRRQRRSTVAELAVDQAQVISRAQLYKLGMSRAEVRAEVSAGRWQRIGRHCLAIHCGPLTVQARHWVAVLEAGPRAFIDGESALVLAGLEHFKVERIRVTVPRGARIRHRGGTLNIRQTRRWSPDDVEPLGLPRARVAVAAIRAALWAKSDRQAALVLTMVVQQGLTTVEALSVQLLRIRRDRRRALLQAVLLDLLGGVRSLSELDVLRGCRDRGLPEPDLQALRRTSGGTVYLDFRWKCWKVVLEVDGIQHSWAQQLVPDALRHNRIAMSGDVVLRLPVLGLRACPDEFFDQLEEALRSAGWHRSDLLPAS
jgi:very-short-patch-repair endonuclease